MMISKEELNSLYKKTLYGCETLEDEKKVMLALDNEHKDEIRKRYCNLLLYDISSGYMKYSHDSFVKNELIRVYMQVAKLLPEEYTYLHIVYNFFAGNKDKCLSLIEKYINVLYEDVKDIIKNPEEFIDESLFIDMFFEPFKQAFQGFWTRLGKILRKYPVQKGLPELCNIIDEYYSCKTDLEALNMLLVMLQKHSDLTLIKELLGYTYYSMKMWNNAIAYFENLEDNAILFFDDDLYFMLAWSYGKIKDYKREEECYRKVIAVSPNNINALNNLGYSLYRQKKYSEALTYFGKCLEKDCDYIYAANNSVKTLIAMGRNKDAKTLVKSGKYKISQEFIKRVEKLDDSNARISKHSDIVVQMNDDESQKNTIDLGIKRQQFSNEKLLEDELTAKIEAGMDVFGLGLKIYKRKGAYGRQYIIPVGRLDLLCENSNGDLYIIELKKDSGYDDAYNQTAAYIEWFEKSEVFGNKKIYGIICVNSPSQDLIDKVHKDKRIKLFEYSISYKEV